MFGVFLLNEFCLLLDNLILNDLEKIKMVIGEWFSKVIR